MASASSPVGVREPRFLPGRVLLAVAFVLLAATAASAQVGGITVLVTDGDGQPLAGATVTLAHDIGYVKTTSVVTTRDGLAEFPVLRPGPGYSIQVAFPGLNAIRYDDVRVKIDENQTLTVQMLEEFEEQVRVTAARDVIDLDKTETSTKFSDDFIADLPVLDRFYQNVLTLAPGVQDADGDGNPNVHGSRSRDFQAVVSGVSNVDPLTGQWLSRVNPNSIEEMEVITAGAGVEFGRAQGGFARIVQKQGSNEHEGIVEFYYQSSKLDGDGSGSETVEPTPSFDTYQPGFQFSGPIVKDKLWYRASYERRDREEPVNVLTGIEIYTIDTETRDFQVTWQASPRNKLALQYSSDPVDEQNFGISNLIPPDASQARDRDVSTWRLTWTAPYSPKVLVDTTLAWQDVNLGTAPAVQGVVNDCTPDSIEDFLRLAQCTRLSNNRISGSYFRTEEDRRQRFTVKGQATVYGGRFWGANHRFKLGINVENERYFRDLLRTATSTYEEVFPFGGDPFAIILTRLAIPQGDFTRATGTNWAIYAEDQIKPLSGLTVTVGARIDREELTSEGRKPMDLQGELQAYEEWVASAPNEDVALLYASDWPEFFTGYEQFESFESQLENIICEGQPAASVGNCKILVGQAVLSQKQEDLEMERQGNNIHINNTNVSPFLSVAWSPFANGKTAIKAAAGRHYNNIPLIIPLQELEPVLTDVEYRASLVTGQTKLEGTVSPRINVSTVDHDLRTPYQDEFTVSFERELWPETSIQVTYINRQFKDQIQDTNINQATGDYGRCSKLQPFTDPVVGSPGGGVGSGKFVLDPYTGEVYEDTDPGIGDGRIDDCVGMETFFDPEPGVGDFGQGQFVVQAPDGFDDLYFQNPFWGDVFQIANLNEIDYEAWVVELIRRQYRSWEMSASYTWSETEGDGEDFFQELANDPSLRASIRGFQSYDQRHVVKVNATTITPWGMRLGTAVSWQSGLPYSLLLQRTSFDTLPTSTLPFGGTGSQLRQLYPTGVRNDQRNSAYWNFDLKATKEFTFQQGLNLQLSAEIFNLFDDDTYQIYNPFFESGQQVNGVNEAQRRFGRRWQLGMKLSF